MRRLLIPKTKSVGIYFIIFGYFLLAGIFGNGWVQRFGSFYILLGVCITFCFLHINVITNPLLYHNDFKYGWNSLIKSFLLFETLAVLYFIASYLDLFRDVFNLNDYLDFKISYIPRHGYVIFGILISLTLAVAIKLDQFIYQTIMNPRILRFLWVILYICRELGRFDMRSGRPLSAFLALALYTQCPNRLSTYGILFLTIMRLSNTDQSTSVLAIIVVILLLIFWNKFYLLLSNTKFITFTIVGGLLIVCILTRIDVVEEMLHSDLNWLWRWQYWSNEVDTLSRTALFGVGFGTAYGNTNLLYESINPGVWVSSSSVAGDGLFLIAQHNSLMNILYRLGLLGLILFVACIVAGPISLAIKAFIKAKLNNDYRSDYLKFSVLNFIYNFVIIIINPGLESPVFALGFFVSLGFMLGMVLNYAGISNEVND